VATLVVSRSEGAFDDARRRQAVGEMRAGRSISAPDAAPEARH
jgi:hypothetical protein